MKSWHDEYDKLDLLNGKISFVSDDTEDMIKIDYPDGMQIDIGYIEHTQSYVITVVSNDTEEAWEAPLEEIKVKNKAELLEKMQEVIDKYRQDQYLTFALNRFDSMWKMLFFHDFKQSRKKYGWYIAIGFLFLSCVIRGLSRKLIWGGTFWDGFLYPFAVFLGGMLLITPVYILSKKAPKAGAVVARILLILCLLFLAGIFLLLIVLLLNAWLHFWF